MDDVDALKKKWYKIVDMLISATDKKDIERLEASEVKAGVAYFAALNGSLTKGEYIVAVVKKIEEECIADGIEIPDVMGTGMGGKATIKPKNLIELQDIARDDGPMIATSAEPYKEKVWRGVCIFCHNDESRQVSFCSYGLAHEYPIALEKPKQVAKKDNALCKLCGLHPKNPKYNNNNCVHQ